MRVRPSAAVELDPHVVLEENPGGLAVVPDPLGEAFQARHERAVPEEFGVFDLERQKWSGGRSAKDRRRMADSRRASFRRHSESEQRARPQRTATPLV